MENQNLNKIKNILQEYVEKVVIGEGKEAGRSHFLKTYENPYLEVLKILQRSWLKGESDVQIAKAYNVSYVSIYRLRKHFEQYKEVLIKLIEEELGEKKYFYVIEKNGNSFKVISDYENVVNFFMRYMRSTPEPKLNYVKAILKKAEDFWFFNGKKDPKDWSLSDVDKFIVSLREKGFSQSYIQGYVIAIRQVAPHLIEKGLTTDWTKSSRSCDLFLEDVKKILDLLYSNGMEREAFIFKLHITIGSREKSFCNLTIDNFDFERKILNVYESKTKGGITWKNINYNWLFNLDSEIKRFVLENKRFVRNYSELRRIYERISKIAGVKIIPHFARKIHVNILWQLGVPLELVAGQILGKIGLCVFGVGWSDLNTLRKHYLALSITKQEEVLNKVKEKAQEILLKK